MKNRPFAQVDVFTAVPYLGNPLAVVLDGTGPGEWGELSPTLMGGFHDGLDVGLDRRAPVEALERTRGDLLRGARHVRIRGRSRVAVDRGFDQLLLVGLVDVIGADLLEHVAEQIELAIGVGRRGTRGRTHQHGTRLRREARHVFLQGVGDEVLFANIIPDLVERLGPAGRLTIAVEPRLVALFSRAFPTATVCACRVVWTVLSWLCAPCWANRLCWDSAPGTLQQAFKLPPQVYQWSACPVCCLAGKIMH